MALPALQQGQEDRVVVEHMVSIPVVLETLHQLRHPKETQEEMAPPQHPSLEVEEVVPEAQVNHMHQIIMEGLVLNFQQHSKILYQQLVLLVHLDCIGLLVVEVVED